MTRIPNILVLLSILHLVAALSFPSFTFRSRWVSPGVPHLEYNGQALHENDDLSNVPAAPAAPRNFKELNHFLHDVRVMKRQLSSLPGVTALPTNTAKTSSSSTTRPTSAVGDTPTGVSSAASSATSASSPTSATSPTNASSTSSTSVTTSSTGATQQTSTTNSNNNNNNGNSTSNNGISGGGFIGIGIGAGIFLLSVVLGIVYLFWRRNKKKKARNRVQTLGTFHEPGMNEQGPGVMEKDNDVERAELSGVRAPGEMDAANTEGDGNEIKEVERDGEGNPMSASSEGHKGDGIVSPDGPPKKPSQVFELP